MSGFNFFFKYKNKKGKVYAIICERYLINEDGLLCYFDDGTSEIYEDFIEFEGEIEVSGIY